MRTPFEDAIPPVLKSQNPVHLSNQPRLLATMTMQIVTSDEGYRLIDGNSASKTAIPGCL
jgi:hypothetical protein